MPTALAHATFGLALAPAVLRGPIAGRVLALGAACAVAPDLDVLGFAAGVPYAHPLGHRGFSHSLPAALLLAGIATAALRVGVPSLPWLPIGAYLFLAAASHGLLDAMTDGGLGVALFAPFDDARHFFAFRPIAVSPLGLRAFLSERGLEVLRSELLWVGGPSASIALAGLAARRRRR